MRGFFLRWLSRSLRGTVASGAVATASLALSAALVFCLVAVSAGVEGQLGAELRAYGANLLLVPRTAPLQFGMGALDLGPVEEDRALRVAHLETLPPAVAEAVDGIAPGLLSRVRFRGRDTAAAGYPFESLRRLNPMWRVGPRWPAPSGEALAGATLAARLALAPGQVLEVSAGGREARVILAGVLETGGPEDETLFLPLELMQQLAGRPGLASLALVRARLEGRSADEVARALEAAVPGAEARTLRQVAQAEEALLDRVKRLLVLVTVALGAATAFTVAGTLGVLLAGRRQEIGLCLALGAEPRLVRRLLLAEAAVSGALGGAAGSLLGAAAAEAVARSVFGAHAALGGPALPLALAVALAISLGASAWPVRRALDLSPSEILRAP